MKSKELKALPLEDLETKLNDTVKSLYQMRVKATTKELDNTAQIRSTRRDVARLKQAIAQKQTAESRQG